MASKPVPKEERCCETMWDRGFTSRCSRRGSITEGGKLFCKQHAPSIVKAKQEQRNAARSAEWKAEQERAAKLDAAEAETERRAGLFEELVWAVQVQWDLERDDTLSRDEADKVIDILTRAKGTHGS